VQLLGGEQRIGERHVAEIENQHEAGRRRRTGS
jgi:hypothetical protein